MTMVDVILYTYTQARKKVLAIGAANWEKGGSERGLILISSLALIRSPEKIHYRHREVRSGAIFRCKYEAFQR